MSQFVSLADAEVRATEILGTDGPSALIDFLLRGEITAIAGKYDVDVPGGFCLETVEERRNVEIPSWFWKECVIGIVVDEEKVSILNPGFFQNSKHDPIGSISNDDVIHYHSVYDVKIEIDKLYISLLNKKYGKNTVEDLYVSPFFSAMFDAVREFCLKPDMKRPPKKDELIEYFMQRRLSDDTVISANHAQYLATFCRPPEAMKGGNKPMG